MKVGYDYPDSIISFENGEEIEIANLNKDKLNNFELSNNKNKNEFK